MVDTQDMGMQGLSAKGGEGRLAGLRQKRRLGPKSGPIDRVAEEGVADRGKMNPNLVGSARFKAGGQEACHRPRIIRLRLGSTFRRPLLGFAGCKALEYLPM